MTVFWTIVAALAAVGLVAVPRAVRERIGQIEEDLERER
jgi:hypothetical protein